MQLLAQIQTGTVSGDFVTLEQTTSEAFWTSLPQGFAFALIVYCISACVSVVFKLVKMG